MTFPTFDRRRQVMPGHLGRMRPIKRRASRESERSDLPVLTHGRAGPGIAHNSFYHHPLPHIISFRRLITPMPLGKLGFDIKELNPPDFYPTNAKDKLYASSSHGGSSGNLAKGEVKEARNTSDLHNIYVQERPSTSEGSSNSNWPLGRGV